MTSLRDAFKRADKQGGGTIDRQHGALFKLRPSLQTSLEGVHELTLQLVVPRNWRADALRVAGSREVLQNDQWVAAPLRAATVQKLEAVILTKARDLRRSSITG